MPVTPLEAKKLQEKHTQPKFEQVCKKIDAMLIRGETTFSTDLVPRDVRDRILLAYSNAGWNVELKSSPRDGVSWLEFTARYSQR